MSETNPITTVYEVHQAWVEYGEPMGPGEYNDKFGYDLKATFDTRAEAKAYMKKMKAASPRETFEIREIKPTPQAEPDKKP